VIGLMRNMKLSGLRHGITVNAVAPVAATRMGGADESDPDAEVPADMTPELVAPLVAYLCHEDCPVSGEVYAAGGGRFSRIFIAATEGYVQSDREPTPEDVVEHWSTINDEAGYYVPADLPAWAAEYMKHQTPRTL
jgi:NAD(P)-dependent dehydrogenase (short-subunit alcohol dehydrogenase family)